MVYLGTPAMEHHGLVQYLCLDRPSYSSTSEAETTLEQPLESAEYLLSNAVYR